MIRSVISKMETVTLPRTSLNVSRICLGCWQMNDNKANASWDAQSYETSKAIVDKCLDLGINFFDTAEGYAGSEEVLGKCLAGRRDQAVIASKFGFREGITTPPYSAVQIEEAVTRSLRKLQTNYIDLLQIHFPAFLENAAEAVKQLDREVANGRLKSWGVCNFGPKNLKTLLDLNAVPVVNQIGYNLLWRSPEREVLPICKDKDIAVLAYSPLQQGLLGGNYMKLDDVPMGRRRGKHFAPESCPAGRHGTPGCEKELFQALPNQIFMRGSLLAEWLGFGHLTQILDLCPDGQFNIWGLPSTPIIQSLQDIKAACEKAKVPMSKAALSWVLQQENKPIVIVGCRTVEQVVENYNVAKISEELMKELTVATEPVKEKIGGHLDQWVNPDRCE